MRKVRVYEVAKKLNIPSKDLVDFVIKNGLNTKFEIKVVNHMSTVDENSAEKIISEFSNQKKRSLKTVKPKPNTNKTDKKRDTRQTEKNKIDKTNVIKTEIKPTENLKKGTKKTQPNKNHETNNSRDHENNNGQQSEKIVKESAQSSEISVIKISKSITLKELADSIKKPVGDLIKILIDRGLMFNQNQIIDFNLASELAEQFNILLEKTDEIDLFADKTDVEDDEKNLLERPPVVVVMGHVDHGKTSLLDAIRDTNVISTESGGITQHIGAYTVSISGKNITFLDTPGHEAFTAMRMRGAQATDIAVLVVAADDGIMPQTVEAINHAKAANVDIVVAINKIDKPGANIDRVKQELTEYGLVAEDWGGQTICVPVSAKKKIGIDNLLEMIILVAELKELKANPNKKASGIVIEAKLDKGRGSVATVLVQGGTLKVSDPIVVGSSFGKVRAMINDKGVRVKKATPSTPVEILGLSSVPNAGDAFYVTESERQARHLAESVASKDRLALIKNNTKVSLDDLFNQIQMGVKELNIIIKADVQGSVEAVRSSLERLSNEEVKIKTLHGGVGAVTESDIMLASASNAIIIGFNVRPEASAKSIAESEKVDVRLYRVIYDAIEDVKSAMKGLLDPVYEEKVLGHAEIRKLFKASSLGTIGGSYITDGKVSRSSKVRVVRDGRNIYEGEISSLHREKDDVKEVNEGYECGILLSKFNDIKEGDVIEAYVMQEVER